MDELKAKLIPSKTNGESTTTEEETPFIDEYIKVCEQYAYEKENVKNKIEQKVDSLINKIENEGIKDELIDKGIDELYASISSKEVQEFDINEYQITYLSGVLKTYLKLYLEAFTDYKQKKEGDESLENQFKKEFINKIKQAFWLTSELQPKEILIDVQTKKYPINYFLYYCPEEYDNENGVNTLTIVTNKNKIGDYDTIDEEVYSISDIIIPTITSKNNVSYGCKENFSLKNTIMNDNGICFGVDNVNGYVKKPYGIRIEDGKQNKLPSASQNNVIINNTNYFFFHIIDKILSFKMEAWAYIKNIPLPPTAEGNKRNVGLYIEHEGMINGIIYNGIIPFNEFKYYRTKITKDDIFTTNSEDDIPTIRFIKGTSLDELNEQGYLFYKKANGKPVYENKEYQYTEGGKTYIPKYIPVAYKQDVLSISDETAYVSETIYGNMNVELISNTTSGKVLNFHFNINYGDNNTDTKLYFIDAEKAPYPLNNINFKTNDKNKLAVYNINVSDTIMSYGTELNKDYGKGKVNSIYKLNEEDDGDYSEIGYGVNDVYYTLNGCFKIKSSGLDRFYVVAETSNNCRSISPLYDFKSVSINVYLTSNERLVEKQDEDGTITYETEMTYNFATRIVNNDLPYYLMYYPYTVNIKYRIDGDGNYREYENTNEAGEYTNYVSIEKSMYDAFQTPFKLPSLYKKLLASRLLFSVKDCTKLTLPLTINKYGTSKLYGVDYVIDEGIEINENGKIVKQIFVLDSEEPAITIDTTDNYSNYKLSYYVSNNVTIKVSVGEEPKVGGKKFDKWECYTINGKQGSVKEGANITLNGSTLFKPIFKDVKITFDAGEGNWSDGENLKVIKVDQNFVADISGGLPWCNNGYELKEFKEWVFGVSDNYTLRCIKDNKVCSNRDETVKAKYVITLGVDKPVYTIQMNKDSGINTSILIPVHANSEWSIEVYDANQLVVEKTFNGISVSLTDMATTGEYIVLLHTIENGNAITFKIKVID